MAVAVGVLLAVSVGVVVAVGDGLGVLVAVGLGRSEVTVGIGSEVGLGAQAAKNEVKMSAKKALFSMPALYQPSQSTDFALRGSLPGSASQI